MGTKGYFSSGASLGQDKTMDVITMATLAAEFEIDLKRFPGFLIAIGDDVSVRYTCSATIDDFVIDLSLCSTGRGARGFADSPIKSFFLDRMIAKVSRDCERFPPTQFESGLTGFIVYRECLNRYQEALLQASNRLISYFKYKIRHPLLQLWTWDDVLRNEGAFFNPRWTFEGHEVAQDFGEIAKKSGVITLEGSGFLGDFGFGIKKFTSGLEASLQGYVQSEPNVSLFEQFLSEAQGALIAGNHRRAILELAVAVEILVRYTFVAIDEVAAIQAQKKRQPLLKILDDALSNGSGLSFKDSNAEERASLQSLFASRNNIVHNGTYSATPAQIKEWWQATLTLDDWIKAHLGLNP
jgi:hypothetical protein